MSHSSQLRRYQPKHRCLLDCYLLHMHPHSTLEHQCYEHHCHAHHKHYFNEDQQLNLSIATLGDVQYIECLRYLFGLFIVCNDLDLSLRSKVKIQIRNFALSFFCSSSAKCVSSSRSSLLPSSLSRSPCERPLLLRYRHHGHGI